VLLFALMDPPASLLLLTLYSVVILLASLAGGWVPLLVRLTHTRMQVATSFVAGLMLGVGVLHLLPHAWHETRSVDMTAHWLLVGFLLMFFIQRFFHFHHHDVPEEAPEVACCISPEESGLGSSMVPSVPVADPGHSEHRHEHEPEPGEGGGSEHHHDATLAERSAGLLSWGGAMVGLTLHSLIDGLALAASVAAESHAVTGAIWAGFGTFLVVVLHKPFDSMAIGTLMARSGSSRARRHLMNGLFALAIPTGALLFHAGAFRFDTTSHLFLGACLAVAAGTFLCISTSDLLPELQFHTHDRVKLSVALGIGLGVAAVIGGFEPQGHEDVGPTADGGGAVQTQQAHGYE